MHFIVRGPPLYENKSNPYIDIYRDLNLASRRFSRDCIADHRYRRNAIAPEGALSSTILQPENRIEEGASEAVFH